MTTHTAVDRDRQPDLFDQLAVRDGIGVIAEHPLHDGRVVRVEPGAECGDNGIDVHGQTLAPDFFAKGTVHDHFGQPDRKCPSGQPDRKCFSGLEARSVTSQLIAAFVCRDIGDAGAPPATSTQHHQAAGGA